MAQQEKDFDRFESLRVWTSEQLRAFAKEFATRWEKDNGKTYRSIDVELKEYYNEFIAENKATGK